SDGIPDGPREFEQDIAYRLDRIEEALEQSASRLCLREERPYSHSHRRHGANNRDEGVSPQNAKQAGEGPPQASYCLTDSPSESSHRAGERRRRDGRATEAVTEATERSGRRSESRSEPARGEKNGTERGE